MSVGKVGKKKPLLALFVVMNLIMSFMPIGIRSVHAEELSEEVQKVEQIEIQAELKWLNLPDGISLNGSTLSLWTGDEKIESKDFVAGDTNVKFTLVDKFDSEGGEIPYRIKQEAIKDFETTIKGFVVENTYVKPPENTPEKLPVVEETRPVIEVPVVEETPPVVEVPVVEETPPVVEVPVVEETPPAAEIPVVEETPPAAEIPVVEETPPAAEVPVVEETPPVVEVPVVKETPSVVEVPIVEETPPVVEVPVVEETPPVVEVPVIEETPPVVEVPVVEETPPVVEAPVVVETPLISDEPQGSDRIIPSKVTDNIPTYTILSLPTVKQPLKSALSPSIGLNAITSPTTAGQVTYDKSAVPVPGLVNTWDITLRIEGKDTEKSSDIVLVIDRSGSMEGTKMTKAKAAANEFIEALKAVPNTKIGVVSFSSAYNGATTVTTHTPDLLDATIAANRDTLNGIIDGLVALGGTNTQAGIRAGAALLSSSTADQKNLILLSDGLPTQSFQINDVTTKLEAFSETVQTENGNTTGGFRTKTTMTGSDYIYETTVGYGSAPYTRIGNRGSNNYYSHSNSAIAQATMFKILANGRTLWTIGLETNADGNTILSSIASPGKAKTGSSSDLAGIFAAIAGSINAAAKNIVVTDPIAPGFEIIPNALAADITTSQGSKTYINRVISWDAGDLSTPISTGSLVRYVQMTYRISIIPSILTINRPLNGKYPTNGITSFVYQDSTNQTLTKYFTVPEVNPIFLKVKKVFLDSEGIPITPAVPFDINIISSARGDLPFKGFNRFNKDFTLTSNANFVESTELRLADTYTVSETTPGYDVIYEVNGVETNTFTVAPPNPGDTGQNDIEVVVTNKLLGKIVLKKLLVDVDGNTITGNPMLYPFDQGFTFTITGPNGYNTTRIVKANEEVTISGLRYGIYLVTETGYPTNFEFVSSAPSDGKVTLSTSHKEDSVTIKNTLRRNVVVSKLVTGNFGDRNMNFTFTATLTKGAGVAVTFPTPPAGSGYTVSGNVALFDLKHGEDVTLLNLPIGAKLTIVETNNGGHSVSVKENGGSPITGSSITVNIPTSATATSVEFTNNKTVIIDTGVSLDSWPYIMILILLISGGIGGFVWKRKRTDFD